MIRWIWQLGSLAVFCALIACWQLAFSLQLMPPAFLPSPMAVLDTIRQLFGVGAIWPPLFATIGHTFVGWFLASLIGVIVGGLIALFPFVHRLLHPMLEALRPLPTTALLPVFILLIGLNSTMIFVVVAVGALWPTLVSTIHGFMSIDRRLLDLGRLLNMNQIEVAMRIAIPSALSDIIAGMRISLSLSLIMAVVAEMVSSQPGLGQFIIAGARRFDSSTIFACILILGLLGYVINQCLELFEDHFLQWRRV